MVSDQSYMLQLALPVTMVTLSTEHLSELVNVPKNGLDPTLLVNVSTVIKQEFEKKCLSVCGWGGEEERGGGRTFHNLL